jgi:hypothetical protein
MPFKSAHQAANVINFEIIFLESVLQCPDTVLSSTFTTNMSSIDVMISIKQQNLVLPEQLHPLGIE